MIIIGYQGIGKSTLAGTKKYIDLESENMWVNGTRSDDWYIPYCQIAIHLSGQGYDVFISSHQVVRDYLKTALGEYNLNVIEVFPSVNLQDAWIEKLQTRYNHTQLEKDYKALMNAKDRYKDNINELTYEPFYKIIIEGMYYKLDSIIKKCKHDLEVKDNNVLKNYI